MDWDSSGDPYKVALVKGFGLAHDLGRRCGPVHVLVGVSECGDPTAQTLFAGEGPSLREVVTANDATFGEGAAYLLAQVQGGARMLAAIHGENAGPAHLLVALIDQATPEVLAALRLAGLNPATVRAAALAAIGQPADLPRVPLPALVPAGTMDRPPLPLWQLDTSAWAALAWRQEHLPLRRLGRRSDWSSLSNLEHRTAERVADKLGLDDDQRCSLAHHHMAEVERRVAQARPGLVPQRPGRPVARPVLGRSTAKRWRRRPRFLNFTVGWGTWFGNRRTGLRNAWFRARTARAYRGAPSTSQLRNQASPR